MAKKSDKISSKVRTKKTKTKKSKSSKIRRRHDSVSDDSRSLSSESVFSSEEDRRRSRKVRSRSRGRKDVKGSRKRAYSSDNSDESAEPRKKKRKTVKKKKKNEVKKRKRKARRNAWTGSESRSCSTCEGGDEIESKRDRVRDEKRTREGNEVESGYRSRSRSLCREDIDSGCRSQEKVTDEGNGRRLRSVIVVPKGFNEGGQKEEMTYDTDVYPSDRSNDSEDGEIKRELDDHSLQVAEEVLVSDAQVCRIPGSDNFSDKDGGWQVEGNSSSCDGIKADDHVNGNKISAEISSLKDEDLETVLRQKALENLKRFKGKPQKIAVVGDKDDKKQPSGAEVELVQIESPKLDVARIEVVKSSEKDVSQNELTRLVEGSNGSPAQDPVCLSEISEKESTKKKGREETVSVKEDVDDPTHQEAAAGSSKMVSTTTVVDKPNLTVPKSRSFNSHPILKRALASLQPHQDRIPVTETSVCNTGIGTAESVAQSSNTDDLDITNSDDPSGENRSDSQQNEGKDDSQFEQKTMSVMRGSEMVQVSYKVYIPKRAPALARRQLKR